MATAIAENDRRHLRAEAGVPLVCVPEAAPERVQILSSWDAGAHHQGRYLLKAPRLGSRVAVYAMYHTSFKEEDPITTHMHVP